MKLRDIPLLVIGALVWAPMATIWLIAVAVDKAINAAQFI